MKKHLTIGIPTFNRDSYLDRQLAWLSQAISGLEDEVEIIVSDNASTDLTQDVIKRWKPCFTHTTFRVERQKRNIGAIRNIAYCISAAEGEHVWIISDDDQIDTETLRYVLQIIKIQPSLGLLILNYTTYNQRTGETIPERWFNFDHSIDNLDGKTMFEACMQVKKAGGVALTTALVYRTDLAQKSLKEWPAGVRNLGYQIYISAYCAMYGNMKVTAEPHLQFTKGGQFWTANHLLYFRFRFAEMPELYVKLAKLGYSKSVCKNLALAQTQELFSGYPLRRLRTYLKESLGVPYTIAVIPIRHLAALLWFFFSTSL